VKCEENKMETSGNFLSAFLLKIIVEERAQICYNKSDMLTKRYLK
jgi:hypothetical protein